MGLCMCSEAMLMIVCLSLILRVCLWVRFCLWVWSSEFLPHVMCECVDMGLCMCSEAMLMIVCLSVIIACLLMHVEQWVPATLYV